MDLSEQQLFFRFFCSSKFQLFAVDEGMIDEFKISQKFVGQELMNPDMSIIE